MPQAIVILSPPTVLPGQSTSIFWGVCPDDGGPSAPSVTVQIYVDGMLVFPLSGSQPQTPSTGGTLVLNQAQLSDAHFDVSAFYQAGSSHTVTVVATPTGSTTPLAPAQATLKIAATIPAPTLTWNAFATPPQWKVPYTLGIQIRNNAAAITGYSCTLRSAQEQVDNAGNLTGTLLGPFATIDTKTTPSPGVTPGTEDTLLFSPITQSWQWLLNYVYVITAQTTQAWKYQVEVVATDQFENTYPAFTTSAVNVEVSVSQEKLQDAQLAVACAAGAAACTVIGVIAGIFSGGTAAGALGAGAAALVGTAKAFGDAAQDPPAPDPEFATRVDIKPVDLSALNLSSGGALGQWVQAVSDFASYRSLVFPVQAKVLGAIAAKDAKMESANVGDHATIVRKMAATVKTLGTLAPGVAQQIAQVVQGKDVASTLASVQAQMNAGTFSFDASIPPASVTTIKAAVTSLTASDLDLRSHTQAVLTGAARLTALVTRSALEQYVELRPQATIGNLGAS